MASKAASYIKLAQSLPPRLQVFLARYPPASILPAAAPAAGEGEGEGATAPPPPPLRTMYQEATPNPFLPTKHPVTGQWHNPVYSLRRQAELVKLARESGVEELLPAGPKGGDERLRHRVEHGLRVKGTGVGQSVKGHIHERHLVSKMEKRRKAMRDMPKLISEWKRVRSQWRGEAFPPQVKRFMYANPYFFFQTGRQEKLDQVPEINMFRLLAQPSSLVYINCTNTPAPTNACRYPHLAGRVLMNQRDHQVATSLWRRPT
ncbi:hypothetical protein RB594_002848 [Gaeumannomyces avenae]